MPPRPFKQKRGVAKPKLSLSTAEIEYVATPAGFAKSILGMDLYPKQADVMNAVAPRGSTVSFKSCNEGGKALALDTLVPTPTGWETMESLAVGDVIYGSDGRECKVVFTTSIMRDRKCYRVEFSDGETIVADAEHLWETDYCQPAPGKPMGQCRTRGVFTTEQIKDTLRYRRGKAWGGAAHSIPLSSIDGQEKQLPFDPYLLGVWLGDGSTGNAEITCDQDDAAFFVARLEAHGFAPSVTPDKRGSRACRVSFAKCKDGLQFVARKGLSYAGVLNDKHIPMAYLRSSRAQRMEMLRGLMDTDGYADERGACEIISTRASLAYHIHELALSLGYKAALRTGRALCNGKDCGPKWRICFRASSANSPFTLPRKHDRLPASGATERPATKRFITAIEPVESVPVRCIQVSSPDHCFLVGRGFIKTHNTKRVICGLILWHLFAFPRGHIMSTSGSFRQIRDQLLPSLHAYQSRFPKWRFLRTPTIQTDRIECFWEGFSTSDAGKFEGHHEDGPEQPLMIVVDEAKTVKDDIFEAVERCKATRLLIASSPGYAEGEFYRSHTTRAQFYKTFTQRASECPHWKQADIDRITAKWGAEHPLVRSMIHAEFMPFVQDAIIDLRALEDLMAEPPQEKRGERKAFCDFAWSEDGDENVMALRDGNVITIPLTFRDPNLHSICGRFIAEFTKNGLKAHEIEGDESGGGHLIIDQLHAMGWPIIRTNNGAAPRFDEHYENLASEMWYDGGQKIARREVILPDDMEMKAQMLDRKKKFSSKGKLAVESKKDMKASNRVGGAVKSSPDRADAVFGAMAPLPRSTSMPIMGHDRELMARFTEAFETGELDPGALPGASC
jgi:hypothetical protein